MSQTSFCQWNTRVAAASLHRRVHIIGHISVVPSVAPRYATFRKKKKKAEKKRQSLSLPPPLLTHLLHGMDNVLLMGRLRLIRLITRRNQTDPREIKLFLPFIPRSRLLRCCSFLGRMLKYFNHRGALPPPAAVPRRSDIRTPSERASDSFLCHQSACVCAEGKANTAGWVGVEVSGSVGGWGGMHNAWACGTSRWQALSNYLRRPPISM